MSPRPRTRVKICGITRPEDAVAASEAGADAIGLVFYAPSPRAVDLAQARAILRELPPFVTVVGLFVNPAREAVDKVLAAVPLDLLQFHGDEDAVFCAGFARPYVKALRVRPDTDLPAARARYASARGLLLDAWHERLYGGTGAHFDWTLLHSLQEPSQEWVQAPAQESAREPSPGQPRIILAGGLTPGNVAAACRLAQPWAVDVSSGVESAPGLKSAALISQFIEEVHNV